MSLFYTVTSPPVTSTFELISLSQAASLRHTTGLCRPDGHSARLQLAAHVVPPALPLTNDIHPAHHWHPARLHRIKSDCVQGVQFEEYLLRLRAVLLALCLAALQ